MLGNNQQRYIGCKEFWEYQVTANLLLSAPEILDPITHKQNPGIRIDGVGRWYSQTNKSKTS